MFEKLGIAEQVAAKTKLAAGGPNGRVSVLVASGEAEIGLQQVSELLSNPDVEVIGMLPPNCSRSRSIPRASPPTPKKPDAATGADPLPRHARSAALYKTKGLEL